MKNAMEQVAEQVNELSLLAEEISNPPMQHIRTSSRASSLTEQGREMHERKAKKQEKAFSKSYKSWKQAAKIDQIEIENILYT